MSIITLTPSNWKNYQLIDSGEGEKLEKFGDYIVSRPEPQALWDKSLPQAEWEKQATAFFNRDKGSNKEGDNTFEKGDWKVKRGMEQRWFMNYQPNDMNLTFKLALSSFKHVGIFPEQAANWDYIYNKTKALPVQNPRVLNLFAYTGGASLAAKKAGADVTHVDSVKQVITWARENMEASGLDNIRWVVEDAFKYVQREVRRGSIYQGIILDPPAYGRGTDGEKWVLVDQINEMLKLCSKLLDKKNHFLVLNLYSLGLSSLIAENLITNCFGKVHQPEFGELFLADKFDKKLPLGTFYRFASL